MGLEFSRRQIAEYDVYDGDRHIGIVRRTSSRKPGGRWEAVQVDGQVLEGRFLTRRAAAEALEGTAERV